MAEEQAGQQEERQVVAVVSAVLSGAKTPVHEKNGSVWKQVRRGG